MKPLLWKELKENVRWGAIGFVVVALICWGVNATLDRSSQVVLFCCSNQRGGTR